MKNRLVYWMFRFASTWRWYLGAKVGKEVRGVRLQAFVREVYQDDRHYHAFDLVRAVRRYWQSRKGRVNLRSLGAPSKTTNKTERSVSSLVATNAIADREGRLLFRLALWLGAQNLLEFGTNAGLSTLYLHAADTRAHLATVEGNPEVAALAKETFAKAGVGPGLRAHVCLFQEWLDTQNEDDPVVDLFFLDGDHREAPTLSYVRSLLSRVSPTSVFVIADIHWSAGMERAWKQLKTFPKVKASLDLYHFGILFFDPEMEEEHVSLAPTVLKPWRAL
ncbi:MAG: class I SAM-dependent methyltransferase [Bacteroidota bacterium]